MENRVEANKPPEQPEPGISQILEYLRRLKACEETIPEKIMHGRDGKLIYKCQRTWFQAVMIQVGLTKLHLAFHKKIIPQELIAFEERFDGDRWHPERVTKEDIDIANVVIDISTQELEKI